MNDFCLHKAEEIEIGYTMKRYLLSTYYEQSRLQYKPFRVEIFFLLQFQQASSEWRAISGGRVGCVTAVWDKGGENERRSDHWRRTETWGKREISAIAVNGEYITYLLLSQTGS